jgi:hypothetical protein
MTAATALRDALSGVPAAVDELESAAPEEIAQAVHDQTLLLRASAVESVIQQYATHRQPAASVQRWAALLRWGFVSSTAGGTRRSLGVELDIEYEAEYEDAINEALARLDELGDIIDGEISDSEAFDLIRALRVASNTGA